MVDSNHKIVAEAMCNLGECIGGARGHQHDVCPASKFNMKDWVSNLECPLDGRNQ